VDEKEVKGHIWQIEQIQVIEIKTTSEYNLSTDDEYSISEFNRLVAN
jgi:hypothetical protein